MLVFTPCDLLLGEKRPVGITVHTPVWLQILAADLQGRAGGTSDLPVCDLNIDTRKAWTDADPGSHSVSVTDSIIRNKSTPEPGYPRLNKHECHLNKHECQNWEGTWRKPGVVAEWESLEHCSVPHFYFHVVATFALSSSIPQVSWGEVCGLCTWEVVLFPG